MEIIHYFICMGAVPCRFQYEEEVRRSPLNYDNWFDYVKLEESTGDIERVREVSGKIDVGYKECENGELVRYGVEKFCCRS
jgi:hypothetical protein